MEKILKRLFLFVTIWFCALNPAQAQLALGFGGPPNILLVEGVTSDSKTSEGLERQFLAVASAPLYRSDSFSLFSQVNYQNLALKAPTFPQFLATDFESVAFSLNSIIKQENGDGWVIGGSLGSASDQIFSSSDVFTYNLIVQRKNKWSDTTAFLYGIFYSNNNAVLPGLPIPSLAYEVQNPETGDFLRIGFPLVWRKNQWLPQTQLSLFAIGPAIWDIHLKNSSLSSWDVTVGAQKRPETFLLNNSPIEKLDQLLIEQIAVYSLFEWKILDNVLLGARAAYNFNNHFRLRETGTTSDQLDQDRRFSDYATFSINLRLLPPKRPQIREAK